MQRYDPAPAARVAYAAVRQLREEQGCTRGPVWCLLVREEQSWYIRHVERALMGLEPRQIQDAWRVDLTEYEGEDEAARWRVGPEIDHVKRTHPELAEWRFLEEIYRRRFFVIQAITVGVLLTVPAPMGDSPCVTVL
jgi:hypothetical protein